nr:hypothetical protein BaRGS_020354 [Batillaria attramentaria]
MGKKSYDSYRLSKMADVKRLVFSILTFLEDQKKTGGLDDEQVESLEAYSKLNKHQQAIEDCNRALSIDPSYSKAYGRMGIAFTALNDHESARECYRKALELDPDNQSYQNNLEIAEQKLREAAAGATSLMSNPQMQQIGQQLATQIQQENPELVEQLRSQIGRGGPGGNPAGEDQSKKQ